MGNFGDSCPVASLVRIRELSKDDFTSCKKSLISAVAQNNVFLHVINHFIATGGHVLPSNRFHKQSGDRSSDAREINVSRLKFYLL